MTGLKPRDFVWVIAGRLATAQRIGGQGVQHRRVRREEELDWLKHEAHVNTVVTLLPGNQNIAAYEEVGFTVYHFPMAVEFDPEEIPQVFEVLDEALKDKRAVVLAHRDISDETMGGILAGYLVHSDLVEDPIVASAVIQEILGRPLGPMGRSMIPTPQ